VSRYHQRVWRAVVIVLVACGSSAEPAPTPTPEPKPKPPLPPPVPDPPKQPDLQCYYYGPKEWIRLKTDTAKMTGELDRVTVGPAPVRHLKVKVVADGPIYDLIFDGYYPDDYKPLRESAPRQKRPETLVVGKSEVARLVVVANKPRILGTGVDLHTGMMLASPDGSYPCGMSSSDPSLKVAPR
jgi:hypothetical protein